MNGSLVRKEVGVDVWVWLSCECVESRAEGLIGRGGCGLVMSAV